MKINLALSIFVIHVIALVSANPFQFQNMSDSDVLDWVRATGNANAKISDTPLLIIAAKNGRTKLIQPLVKAGADVNALDKQHISTALIAALKGEHPETAAALLSAGANPNIHSEEAIYSPLWIALEKNYLKLLEPLKKAGANMDITFYGLTALINAILDSDVHKAIALLKAGADPNKRDEERHFIPLILAVTVGLVEVVKEMVKNTNLEINAKDSEGKTALDVAIKMGISEIEEVLREHGAKRGN